MVVCKLFGGCPVTSPPRLGLISQFLIATTWCTY